MVVGMNMVVSMVVGMTNMTLDMYVVTCMINMVVMAIINVVICMLYMVNVVACMLNVIISVVVCMLDMMNVTIDAVVIFATSHVTHLQCRLVNSQHPSSRHVNVHFPWFLVVV